MTNHQAERTSRLLQEAFDGDGTITVLGLENETASNQLLELYVQEPSEPFAEGGIVKLLASFPDAKGVERPYELLERGRTTDQQLHVAYAGQTAYLTVVEAVRQYGRIGAGPGYSSSMLHVTCRI